jgi:hypothetical protein
MAIRVSAAPQPRCAAPTYGWLAFEKICKGSAVLAPLNTFVFAVSAAPMQKSSGAVSPAARATASRTPLTIPPIAAGSTTVTVTRALVAPRA